MEAPKKIKIGKHNITSDSDVVFGWVTNEPDCEAMQHDIEYTRTDAFIEKALSWLKNHYRDYMYNPTGKRLEAFFGIDMCNDFENYIKGE